MLNRNLQIEFLAFKPHALPSLVFNKQKTKGVFFKDVFNIPWAPISTKWLLLKFRLHVKMKQKPSNEFFTPIGYSVLIEAKTALKRNI